MAEEYLRSVPKGYNCQCSIIIALKYSRTHNLAPIKLARPLRAPKTSSRIIMLHKTPSPLKTNRYLDLVKIPLKISSITRTPHKTSSTMALHKIVSSTKVLLKITSSTHFQISWHHLKHLHMPLMTLMYRPPIEYSISSRIFSRH